MILAMPPPRAKPSHIPHLHFVSEDAAAIGGPQITQAASEGDPAALRCFSIVGTWLGQRLADLTAILDPGCIVVGGGVSEAGELLLGPARAAFGKALTGAGYRPRVEISQGRARRRRGHRRCRGPGPRTADRAVP